MGVIVRNALEAMVVAGASGASNMDNPSLLTNTTTTSSHHNNNHHVLLLDNVYWNYIFPAVVLFLWITFWTTRLCWYCGGGCRRGRRRGRDRGRHCDCDCGNDNDDEDDYYPKASSSSSFTTSTTATSTGEQDLTLLQGDARLKYLEHHLVFASVVLSVNSNQENCYRSHRPSDSTITTMGTTTTTTNKKKKQTKKPRNHTDYNDDEDDDDDHNDMAGLLEDHDHDSSHGHNDHNHDQNCGHEDSVQCGICRRGYQYQDVVCWSHNRYCPHAFHADCAMEHWCPTTCTTSSTRQDCIQCPICARQYL